MLWAKGWAEVEILLEQLALIDQRMAAIVLLLLAVAY